MLARPLPVHPTLLHPLTGLPQVAVGYRRNGRPIWPVMGGSGEGEGTGEGEGEGGKGAGAGGGRENDLGFPAETPLAEMTAEQQIAYWKHQSRKHESTAKARGDYDDLKAKAAAHDALQDELRSDEEKKTAAAVAAAKAETQAAYAPKLLAAEFRANAAGRQVNGQPLNVAAIVGGLDAKQFLDAAGDVDAAKVTAFLDSIAPVATVRPGPSPHGTGHRPPADTVTGKDAGRAEAEKRFGKTTTTLTPSR